MNDDIGLLTVSDLLLLLDVIAFSFQWKHRGMEVSESQKIRLALLSGTIHDIVIARAKAGDVAAIEVVQTQGLTRKPVSAETRTMMDRRKEGTSNQ